MWNWILLIGMVGTVVVIAALGGMWSGIWGDLAGPAFFVLCIVVYLGSGFLYSYMQYKKRPQS
jgi:hypothetical protein